MYKYSILYDFTFDSLSAFSRLISHTFTLKESISSISTLTASHHEGGHVSVEVGGRTRLRHVRLLRLHDVLLLLLDPAGGDLQHQTLQEDKRQSFIKR